MQEHALATAQARIAQLEGELTQRPAGGGFLSGLFGGGQVPRAQPVAQGPLSGVRPGGGGFLGGALQTAMGIAGGMLVGNMLMNAFSADPATAVEGMVNDATADFLPEAGPALTDGDEEI
nr:DUF2076 family protein [Arboricoccus pini]